MPWTQNTLSSHSRKSCWHLSASSLPPSSRKEAEGRCSTGSSARLRLLSSQARGLCEGFGNYYNHLLCWVEMDPVPLCFRL